MEVEPGDLEFVADDDAVDLSLGEEVSEQVEEEDCRHENFEQSVVGGEGMTEGEVEGDYSDLEDNCRQYEDGPGCEEVGVRVEEDVFEPALDESFQITEHPDPEESGTEPILRTVVDRCGIRNSLEMALVKTAVFSLVK